ncbi:hypothetical protein BGX31_007472 [Mortierella sp. GBA43]|nr:hypothetical protein BGX31_007472 [Mortierella sp. GBA43]
MTSSQTAGSSSAAAAAAAEVAEAGEAQEPHIEYPPSYVSSLKPIMGAFTPQLDNLKKGKRYISDTAAAYEASFGSEASKTAGSSERTSSSSSSQPRKPTSRSKAAQAAYAEMMAFSEDGVLHGMEDAMLALIEMQRQVEIEQNALNSLATMISIKSRLPAHDLMSSFEHLIEEESKHQQAQRKQEQKMRPTPGGIDHELLEMRRKVWDVHHNMQPIPTAGGGSSSGSGANAGDNGDEEDDVEMMVVENNHQSFKCPITTNYLEDPVTSSLCKHTFSKVAIMELIHSRGQLKAMCPVHEMGT